MLNVCAFADDEKTANAAMKKIILDFIIIVFFLIINYICLEKHIV